jgi:hypothetical protein
VALKGTAFGAAEALIGAAELLDARGGCKGEIFAFESESDLTSFATAASGISCDTADWCFTPERECD